MPARLNRSISTHAPALFLLPGMIIGLCLAQQFKAPLLLVLVSAILLITLCLVISRHRQLRQLWLTSFVLASSLSCWAFGTLRLPPTPSSHQLLLPVREAQLEFKVSKVLQPLSQYGTASGIGKIITAPRLSRITPKDSIYFQIKMPTESLVAITTGLEITATGLLNPIPQSTARDGFDRFLSGQSVYYTFTRTRTAVIDGGTTAQQQFYQHMHARWLTTLQLGAPKDNPVVNIYPAMLLGYKTGLDSQQSQRFRSTGTMHFFAISGLHIGIIASVIAQALLLLRVPRRLAPWLGLPLLYLYVEITGAAPSAVRAFLMVTFFWASYALLRQRSSLAALAGSAIAVLLIAPQQLWSIGFQLSYTVVLSILLFGLPLYATMQQRFRPYQFLPSENWNWRQHATVWASDKVMLLFAISCSAWLASSPLSAGLFGIITPAAIGLNMLLIYFATLVICGGIISIILALIGLPFLSAFLNHAAWLNLSIMDALVISSSHLPASMLHCPEFPLGTSYLILAGYFALLIWLHRNRTNLNSWAVLIPPAWILILLSCGYLWSQLQTQ